MTQKILLDMDPGIDDAAALSIALTDDTFQVMLLTTVAGNVSVDKTTKNALRLVEFFNQEKFVPVAAGASAPLIKKYADAADVHGESGMDGWQFPDIKTDVLPEHAVVAMRNVLMSSPEKITIVATGAFTNIALLIRMYPEVLPKIAQIVLMGGTLGKGNITNVAEFNVFTDPHAAQILFTSGLPIKMIGLNVTLQALLSKENIRKLGEINQTGQMLQALFNHYADDQNGAKPMHDVNTLFYLSQPESFVFEDYHVEVITEGPANGATVANKETDKNVSVAIKVDVEAFNDWFMKKIIAI